MTIEIHQIPSISHEYLAQMEAYTNHVKRLNELHTELSLLITNCCAAMVEKVNKAGEALQETPHASTWEEFGKVLVGRICNDLLKVHQGMCEVTVGHMGDFSLAPHQGSPTDRDTYFTEEQIS